MSGLAGGYRRVDSLLSHQIIEEFMIAANEAVGRVPGRAFPAAGPRAARSRQDHGLLAAFSRAWVSPCPKRPTGTPGRSKASWKRCRRTPLAPMVLLMLLRSLKQARYAGEALGHYGLATEWYTHFTSPSGAIRTSWSTGCCWPNWPARKHPFPGTDDLETMCNHLNKRERLGIEAEREMLARMQVRFLYHRSARTFSGRVTGVNAFGFFRRPGRGLCRGPGTPGGPAQRLLPLR